jgi:hypothetical protein
VLSGEGLLKLSSHQLGLELPRSLLSSAFGDAWQRPGFKVQLSVFKDGACIAGGLAAIKLSALLPASYRLLTVPVLGFASRQQSTANA